MSTKKGPRKAWTYRAARRNVCKQYRGVWQGIEPTSEWGFGQLCSNISARGETNYQRPGYRIRNRVRA